MSNDPQIDSYDLVRMVMNSYEMVHLVTDYAARYGYLLGGLEMIAAGHARAEAVLESFRKKYDTTTAAGSVTKHRTSGKTT